MRLATSLNEKEREEFAEEFYTVADSRLDDAVDGNPSPWGCPWYFGFTVKLNGQTIKEMANNFYQEHENEIVTFFDQEEEDQEELEEQE